MRKKDEIVVDSFAGGGGTSLGISWALGREPDVAINHDKSAIQMHAANHPGTRHFTEDVWKVSPDEVTGDRPIGLFWASPDCKHFSRAKGGKPVEKKIRSLAWVVVRWAAKCAPRLIVLENVPEFEDWGPLVPRWQCLKCSWRGSEGQARLVSSRGRVRHNCPRCGYLNLRETFERIPDHLRKGLTFKRFIGRLRDLGYLVQWKTLDAADYGAPTHRRRLFLIARNDGRPIVWPEPTHADPKKCGQTLFGSLRLWRTAAECIDWSIPCPSIFSRKRPLAEATLRRIAMGIKRYVLDNPRPFLVTCNHGGPEFRGQDLGEPMATITAARDAHGLVVPYLVGAGGPSYSGKPVPVDAPAGTLTTENHRAVITPYLIPHYGERPGQEPRTHPLDEPAPVITPCANAGTLIAPLLAPMTHSNRSMSPSEPMPTVTTQTNRAPLVAAFLAKHYGGVVGCRADEPLPTTTARGTQNQLVAANLVHLNHGEKQWSGCDEPMRTLTASGNHAALVYSFLVKYFGRSIGAELDAPLPTATGKDRFGLATVLIEEAPYAIVDIGMRMLRPRELARAQGFPDSYVLTGSNTSQVEKIGNSVCPVMAKVLVEANYP